MLELILTTRRETRLLERMRNHYSQPKGFVGRTLAYAVLYKNDYYGHILAGSATLHLPNRNEFFGIEKSQLNQIINNVFFNISPFQKKYPIRNFGTKVLDKFIELSKHDWQQKYGDQVIGFETLVEPPRTGEIYLRSGWKEIGKTKGLTCKRIGGKGFEKWGGKRIWYYKTLRPKLVFALKVS